MTSIEPHEMDIVGKWILSQGQVIEDETCQRIQTLIHHHLLKVKTEPSGWETLYRDPQDGRLWELTYPQGELQGGGPPRLSCVPRDS